MNTYNVHPSGIVGFFTGYDLVRMFHRAFNRHEGQAGKPVTQEELALRMRLIDEEVNKELLPALKKFGEAQTSEELAEVFDGLIDSVYVILGTAVSLGLPFDVGFEQVHHANMAKLGPDGKPIIDAGGKVLKPEGWKKADLLSIVKQLHMMAASAEAQKAANALGVKETLALNQIDSNKTLN